MKLSMVSLLFSFGALVAQNPDTAVFPGRVVTAGDLLVAPNAAPNSARSTLAAAISDATSTAVVLADASKFVTPLAIAIDSEIFQCGSKTGNTLTCSRGLEGSARAHAPNTPVSAYLPDSQYHQIAAETRAVESKLHNENLSVIDVGADPTGATHSLAAFNAAFAASDTVRVPAGTYNLGGMFTMNRRKTRLLCDAGAVITYTDSADIDSVIFIQDPKWASGFTLGDNVIDGCTILGNSHVTRAIVHAHSVMGTTYRNLNLNTNSATPPAACLLATDGNTNHFEHITCAGGFSGGNPHPAFVGIQLQDEVEDTIVKPRIEEITNDGIKLNHAAGTACGGTKIISGTSEGNGVNLTITAGCGAMNIDGVDLEAPTGPYGVVDGGSLNRYTSSGPDQTHFLSTARYNVIDGGTISGVTIDRGAVGNKVTHTSFCNNSLPGWLNNGTASELLHNYCANGGNAYPDIYGSPSTVIPSGVNVVRETGANNAIAGKYTPMRTDGGILAETQTCSPLNDGTEFNIQLAHSLQAGANTFNFCSLGARPIRKASDPAKNIAGYPAGAVIKLRWLADAAAFVDLGLSDSPAFSGLSVNGNTTIGDRASGSLISLYTSPHGLTSAADFNWATAGGANNAITASVVDDNNAPIVLNLGTPLNLVLSFSLRAGANTLSLNGGPALPILSARNLGNITNPLSVGAHIRLSYDDKSAAWLDMSQ